MSDYWFIPDFEDLYLEDSWVLSITARPGILEFEVDLVLRESHTRYQAPAPGKQYCYLRGLLRFEDVSSLKWERQNMVPAIDATGELDYGSIDALRVTGDTYSAEGDFGLIIVESAPPSVELTG